ncbi:MAG: 2-phosphosulfolactate phosphatase [Candidatus Heimdallarchaeota archaeon]|nr:2-phosphosulfolactate phosphatase [Candidatus Heimdallarchaeota archaeon]
MDSRPLILRNTKYPVFVRQFEEGVNSAVQTNGITVIFDNFRASNTIIALMESNALIRPIRMGDDVSQYLDWIKIGERQISDFHIFDYDNSPYFIENNPNLFSGKKVVLRTTNGTRGIILAKGSKKIIVGSFKNIKALVRYCIPYLVKNIPINIIAMGSKAEVEISRIEDIYGSLMLYYELLQEFDSSSLDMSEVKQNHPLLRDWKQEIINDRGLPEESRDDRLNCLQLDTINFVPEYNLNTRMLEKKNIEEKLIV